MPVKHDTKDKRDTNNDHSEHAHNTPKPRMTEHDRPTQSGTISKAHQHKPSAHYEITSPGLRFTAHNLRTEAAKKNRKRSTSFVFVWSFIREEKKATLRANDDVEDTDRDDSQGQSKSSVNFALFVGGYNGVPVHICWTSSSLVCCFDFSNKGGGLANIK